MSPELNSDCVDKANKNWLPRQRPLKDRKTNFRLIMYSHISINPEICRSVIGLYDFEITDPTKVVKNEE